MVSVVAYNPATRGFTAEKPRAGTAEPELSIKALRLRVRQQELLADFGVLALKGTPFRQLLHEAARVVADGLTAEFAKVLKYLPEENKFLVCAGVGWDPGVVGVVGADTASPAGYALQTGKAVISNHLDNEDPFRTPELLLQYGIRRAMNVILEGVGDAEPGDEQIRIGSGVTVDIAWRLVEQNGSQVELTWQESGGPTVRRRAAGFGTKLIDRVLRDLGAETEIKFDPQGLRCTVAFPLQRTSAP